MSLINGTCTITTFKQYIDKMKPKKIRLIKSTAESFYLTEDKIYNVAHWVGETYPVIINDKNCLESLVDEKWEPVSEFNHGDPVWAWDAFYELNKTKCIYIGAYPDSKKHVVYVLEKGITVYEFVEHRKPTMTLQELADKADVNLDEVEIVD